MSFLCKLRIFVQVLGLEKRNITSNVIDDVSIFTNVAIYSIMLLIKTKKKKEKRTTTVLQISSVINESKRQKKLLRQDIKWDKYKCSYYWKKKKKYIDTSVYGRNCIRIIICNDELN